MVVETVGVGQSETDVAEVADTVAVVVQPGSGDVLQFLKSGIMEIPDVLVVTKADLGDVAARSRRDLHAALRAIGEAGTPVVAVSAIPPAQGIDELVAALDEHRSRLDLSARRLEIEVLLVPVLDFFDAERQNLLFQLFWMSCAQFQPNRLHAFRGAGSLVVIYDRKMKGRPDAEEIGPLSLSALRAPQDIAIERCSSHDVWDVQHWRTLNKLSRIGRRQLRHRHSSHECKRIAVT